MAFFKAQAMARDLKQRLELTIEGVSVAQSRDAADENPVLSISKGADSIFVKIGAEANDRVDALGLEQRRYSPHVLRMLRETAANQSDAELQAKVLVEATKCGTRMELWEKAVPAAADVKVPVEDAIAGATKIADIRSDAINPLTSQQ